MCVCACDAVSVIYESGILCAFSTSLSCMHDCGVNIEQSLGSCLGAVLRAHVRRAPVAYLCVCVSVVIVTEHMTEHSLCVSRAETPSRGVESHTCNYGEPSPDVAAALW